MGRRLTDYERAQRERERESLAAERRSKTAARRAKESKRREKEKAQQKALKENQQEKQIRSWESEVDQYNKFIDSFSNIHNFSQVSSVFSFKTFARKINFNSDANPPVKTQPQKEVIKLDGVEKPKEFSFTPSSEIDALKKTINISFEKYCETTGSSSFVLSSMLFGTRKKYDKYISDTKSQLKKVKELDSKREEEEKHIYQKAITAYEAQVAENQAEYDELKKLVDEKYQIALTLAEQEYQKALEHYNKKLESEEDRFNKGEEERLDFIRLLLNGDNKAINIACEYSFPISMRFNDEWLNSNPNDHMVGYRIVNSSTCELVISLPQNIEFLPQHGIKMTSSGKSQTEDKISDRERYNIIDDFINSISFAYAIVVYKIAPTINKINIEVSKLGIDPSTGNDKDYNYLTITFDRETFETLNFKKLEISDALVNFNHKKRSIKDEKKVIDLMIDRNSLEWATDDDKNVDLDNHTRTIFCKYCIRDKDIMKRLNMGESIDIIVNKVTVVENDDVKEKLKIDPKPVKVEESPLIEKKIINDVPEKESDIDNESHSNKLDGSKQDLVNRIANKLSEKYSDIEIKHSKTAGIGLYHDGRKFLQIGDASKERTEILILRDYKHEYYRPNIEGMDISNIRKYDPSVESYIRPWGYMFYKVLITENDFLQFGDIIYDLIDDSYNVAVGDKILKVDKTDHEQLGPIFNNTFEINLELH